MKNTLKIVFVLALIFASTNSYSQILNPGEKIPAGAIVYSLPSTTIHLSVEAEFESFVAGPYA
ncbi:MAG: hypothetical protein EOM16_01155, partial [Bacteroidia bacterium]|nr:hypothetical protein [Bacteroidia bacterium]